MPEVKIEISLEEKQAVDSINNLSRSVKTFEGVATASFDKMSAAWDYFKANIAAQAVVKAFGEVIDVLGQAKDELLAFETEVAKINSVLPENAKLTAFATEQIKDFAAQYGTSAANQAQAYYDIVKAGFSDTAIALDILNVSNKAATAGFTNQKNAVEAITDLLDLYGGRGETAASISDKLTVATRASEKSFDEFSGTLKTLAPIANGAGVKFSDLSATLAYLTSNGVESGSAAMGLKAVIGNLIKPSTEAAKAAKEMGIEFNKNALESKGLSGVLLDVMEKTGGNTESLSKLFGGMRELAPMLAIMRTDFNGLKQILNDTNNASGETDKAFKAVTDTTAYQLGLMKAKLVEFATGFFTSNDAIKNIIKTINTWLSSLKDAQYYISQVQIWVALNKETLKAYGEAFLIVTGVIGGLVLAMNAAKIATAAYVAIQSATPWGLAIAGAAALTAAIGFLIQNWDKAVANLQILQNWLTSVFVDTIILALEGVRALASAMGLDMASTIETHIENLQAVKTAIEEDTLAVENNITAKEEAATRQAELDAEAIRKAEEKRAIEFQQAQIKQAQDLQLQYKALTDKQKIIDENNKKTEATQTQHYSMMQMIEAANTQFVADEKTKQVLAEKYLKDEQLKLLTESLGERGTINLLYEAQRLEKLGKHEDAVNKIQAAYGEARNKQLQKQLEEKEKIEKENREKSITVTKSAENTFSTIYSNAQKNRYETLKSSLGMIATLTSQKNEALFRIGQAAALANAVVNTAEGVTKAWALGPILGPIMAALVAVAGAAQIAVISSQSPPRAEFGGIIPGSAYTGDMVNARVNSGEMVLTKRQQSTLYNIAQGMNVQAGAEGKNFLDVIDAIVSQPIIITVDGREIARAVRNESESGFSLARA